MTSEHRTLIEFGDVAGIEFRCRKCGARVLYPLDKHYDRIGDKCPNCLEPWFVEAGNPNAPRIGDEVKRVIATLQNVATSPAVLAQVRLCIAGTIKE